MGMAMARSLQARLVLLLLGTLVLFVLTAASDSHGLRSHVRRQDHEPVDVNTTVLQRFHTEPTFTAVTFDIRQRPSHPSLLAPGLLYMDISAPVGAAYSAPQIYDMGGTLIWSATSEYIAQDLNVCDYLGAKDQHLNVHSKTTQQTFILDRTYKVVATFNMTNGHEFNVLPGGHTALHILDKMVQLDLSAYFKDPEYKNGWALDTCLVELDLKSRNEIFRWCFLDRLPIWHTTIYPKGWLASSPEKNASMRADKAGRGTYDMPWDFMHANSADKFDGDYILSARHLDQILKIAGPHNRHGVKPGTVLWRLGGLRGDFEQDFTFTRQHHIRYISVTAKETVISLFDNAWDGQTRPSAPLTDGKLVKINNDTMKANLLASFPHPERRLSDGRGSTQMLPNGNALIGFGSLPDLTEHLPNGTAIYHARFGSMRTDRDGLGLEHSYRTFKHTSFLGKPPLPPKLLAYSRRCRTSTKSPLFAYVSWNGDMQVASWRFFLSPRVDKDGPWEEIGTFPKKGFETRVRLRDSVQVIVSNSSAANVSTVYRVADARQFTNVSSVSTVSNVFQFTPYVRAQALDANGTVLADVRAQTWVPKPSVRQYCGFKGCENDDGTFFYDEDLAEPCEPEWEVFALVVLVCFIEFVAYVWRLVVTTTAIEDLQALQSEKANQDGETGLPSYASVDREPLINNGQ